MATLGVTNVRFDGQRILADVAESRKYTFSFGSNLDEPIHELGAKPISVAPAIYDKDGENVIIDSYALGDEGTVSFLSDDGVVLITALVRRGEGVVAARPKSQESELIEKLNNTELGDIEIDDGEIDVETEQPTLTEEAGDENCAQKDVRVLVPEIRSVPDRVTGETVGFTESLTEVPTIDEGVETIIDPEGAPMWTKLTDVYFPLEWRGEDYTDVFRGLQDNSGAASAYVQFRAPPNSETNREWQTVHYGYVKQVGSGGSTRKARAVLGDWSDFLSKIEPTKLDGSGGISFDKSTTVKDVLRYVADRYSESVEIVDNVDVTVVDDADVFQETTLAASAPDITNVGRLFNRALSGPKSFKTNRHTLLDVLKFLHDTVGIEWALTGTNDPRTTSLQLVAASQPPRLFRPEDSVSIRRNNALFEIQPINEVKVVGDTPQSIGANISDGGGVNLDFLDITFDAASRIPISVEVESDIASDEYPVAVARYDPLHDRSNGNTLRPPRKELKVSSIDGAKKAAQAALLDELDNAEGGKMILDGIPTLLPYDGIEARPACNNILDTNVQPLTYGAKRIKHVCPATERYATEVDVGLYVDPNEVSFPVAKTEVA